MALSGGHGFQPCRKRDSSATAIPRSCRMIRAAESFCEDWDRIQTARLEAVPSRLNGTDTFQMRNFAQTADRIAATTKKLEKTAILADYLKSIPVDEAAVSAVFFSGRPFPMWEETTLQVGGSLLWRIVQELSGKEESDLTAAYREHGDLGAVAAAVLPEYPTRAGSSPSPGDVQQIFCEISAARGPAAKGALVRKLLCEVSPLEAKYIAKI